MPRENSKCRKWERERRERLNEAFSELAKLLPCYNPSINIPKIDILLKAASNIRELGKNIKNLLSSNTEKKTGTEDIIKKLHDRIKKLLVRNEQLTNILRDAGISVPSACGTIKRFKKQLHWSKRISSEQAKFLQKHDMEKENISSKSIRGKKKKTKTIDMEIAPKHQTVILKGNEQKGVLQKKKRSDKKAPSSNCFIVLSQPATTIARDIGQQCYFIANEPSSNMYKSIIKSGMTNSGMLLKPMPITSKSRESKSLLIINPSLPSLGPGTLLLADGPLLSTLSKFQISTSPNLLLNSAVCTFSKTDNTKNNECNQKHFSTKSVSQTIVFSNVKTLPYIRPKYCLTRTTQVNKVPIPALTSRYANNYFLLNETKSECIKPNEVEKAKKSNKTNQVQELNKSNQKKGDKRKNEVEVESSNKKTKSDCKNESTSNIFVSISDNLNNTSTSANNMPITEDRNLLKTTNNTDPKDIDNDLIENMVIDKVKEGLEYKNNNVDTKVCSSNIDGPVSNVDAVEKKQELVKHTNNESPHRVMTFVSTVTATTLTTTTTHEDVKHLDLNLSHSELSNDIFASLQVPSGCQNPDSTSPTAAFLLAFPLVSSGIKVTEVIDEENLESQRGTPTLLQIGTMDSTKPTQSQSDTITSNFLNLDSFPYFSSKDICGNMYNNDLNAINKSSKSASPTSILITNNKTDTNIKSPCLPTVVAEPVKENYNVFNEKPIKRKEIVENVDGCDKRNNKMKDNINFNSHNQSNSKANSSYLINSKNIDHNERNFDQKSQVYVATTYPNSNCNFSYKSEPSKLCTTCSYVNINRNYTNPLYTNCNNYNYHPDTNFNQNYYKNIPRNETKTYYPLNYENYSDYQKNEATVLPVKYDASTYIKEKKNNNTIKIKTNQNKLPINWMTTPDSRLQSSECLLNSFSKGDFSQTHPYSSCVTSSSTYFITSTDTSNVNCVTEPKKCVDLPRVSLNSHQRPDTEEKQFSWSATKLPHFLEPPQNFVTSTLPTLVGDLALSNSLTFGEQKNDCNKYLKDNKDIRRMNKVSNYENQTNFLSVSQLVERNKPENSPSKCSTRRNSRNESKNIGPHKLKRVTKYENKNLLPSCSSSNNDKLIQVRSTSNYNLSSNETFQEEKNRNSQKNNSSSYSAEALIGNQISDDSVTKRYPPPSNKSLGMSSFLAENIISYFPPVDLPQENYMSQNQSYAPSNFTHNLSTSFQNNTYPTNSFIYTAPTITSTYLSTNSFEPNLHDYLQDNLNLIQNSSNKDNKHYSMKNFNNRQQNKEDKNYQHTVCSNNFRRSKKKTTNESNNGLTNFDLPFVSIPGSNNSPVLPDDFHSHTNFLPPTTPFPCKNLIYSKQGNDLLPLPPASKSNIQHPEISPSMNSVGTSLTNFNLSTIFPEINKGPITEMYTDSRIKEHSHAKSYTSTLPQNNCNSIKMDLQEIMTCFLTVFVFILAFIQWIVMQPLLNAGGVAAADGPPPPPPPGRGFQLRCTDDYAYEDQTDPEIVRQFADNAPPGYIVRSVEPYIFPGKNAHRFLVKYQSQGPRRCEQIGDVYRAMNNYKPQNSNVGVIAVIPGGYLVTYMKYCGCYRRSYRRRRSFGGWNTTFHSEYYITAPRIGPGGTVMRCDDRDLSCGPLYFS